MTAVADFPRRSFVAGKLEQAGAKLGPVNGAAAALDYGDPAGEAEAARRCALADLSPLARCGFKGAGTPEWLSAQGVEVPAESNRAARQQDGALAARLAPGEALLLGDLRGDSGGLPAALDAAWAAEPLPPESPRGFPVPRQDSHAWFLVTGSAAAAMFAKLCGVDLRPSKFPDLAIAQTSVARINAVVTRDDRCGHLAYHLLCDSASAGYLWDCLLDAMAEFEGRPAGLTAVRGLDDG